MPKDRLTLLELSQVWNCENSFQKVCPKSWSSLEQTNTRGVRHCHVCNEDVTYCHTPEEFVELGNQGRCVAVPDGFAPVNLSIAILGRPSVDRMQQETDRQKRLLEWWNTTLVQGPKFEPAAFSLIRETVSADLGLDMKSRDNQVDGMDSYQE